MPLANQSVLWYGPLIHVYPLRRYAVPVTLTIPLDQESLPEQLVVYHSATQPTEPCAWERFPAFQLINKSVELLTTDGGNFIVIKKALPSADTVPCQPESYLLSYQPTAVWLAILCHHHHGIGGGITLRMTCLYQQTCCRDDWAEHNYNAALHPQKIGYFYPNDQIHVKITRFAEPAEKEKQPQASKSPWPPLNKTLTVSRQTPKQSIDIVLQVPLSGRGLVVIQPVYQADTTSVPSGKHGQGSFANAIVAEHIFTIPQRSASYV